MTRWIDLATLVAALGSGTVGGVFFAFSNFIMQALARLPPAQGIAAMQAINITVINRWFMGALFGTALVCLVLVGASFFARNIPGSSVRIMGCVIYVVGTIVVTMICNVPRNDALAEIHPESLEAIEVWTSYLQGWTAWNHVRTVASLLAAALLVLTLFSWSPAAD